MPPTPKVVLKIDDNTPAGEPPFTYDVTLWSFDDDLNLATRTAAGVFREMHKAADSSRFRGYPHRAARGTVELFNAPFGECVGRAVGLAEGRVRKARKGSGWCRPAGGISRRGSGPAVTSSATVGVRDAGRSTATGLSGGRRAVDPRPPLMPPKLDKAAVGRLARRAATPRRGAAGSMGGRVGRVQRRGEHVVHVRRLSRHRRRPGSCDVGEVRALGSVGTAAARHHAGRT